MTIETADTQLELGLGDDEKAVTVEITPEVAVSTSSKPSALETPDENRAAAEPKQKKKQVDELDNYTEKVQKRINKLTSQLRETERREKAALEYAQGVQRQAQDLQQRLHHTDTGRLSEAKTRSETQSIALKQIIRKAREEGDIDTETEAHERLTSLLMEQRRIAEASYAGEQEQQQRQQRQQQEAYQAQQAAQQVVQQRPKPDPRAEEWAERNTWFGQDKVMTHAVWGIHRQMIEEEGFDATTDEYYDELDKRVADTFPTKIRKETVAIQQEPRAQRPVQAVAPATRSSGVNTARRAVRLSPSQVAIAKKLGVPLEEYAKYVKD